MGFVVAPLENFSIKSTGYLMRKQPFLYRRHQLFNMHVRGYIAVAGFAVTVVLGACASEVRTPEPDSETGPEASAALACPTPVSVTALPPQQDFATDIRTVLTGVKSPVQQEALAQAGKIAPGQMSDALCGVLVDEAAFVSYLDHRDDTGDPRLDSLAHFLVCALQPHFSQEELAADLISLTSDDEYLEPVRRARQITAAWLAMHLPAGDMGEELQRAAIKANEYLIGSDLYPMYTAQGFLFEALFKQYAGYSDADFSAEIARGVPAAEVEYIRQIRQAVQRRIQWQAAQAAQDASPEPEVMHSLQDDYFQRELAGLSQQELVARIRAIMEEGHYGICGYEPPVWIFQQFPDTSVALLAEVITRPTTSGRKISDGLELLSELAASWKTGWASRYPGGPLRFSEESRALLIATARHFMEGDFLSSLPMRDTSGVYSFSRSDILYSAFRLALALDDPGLIEILQELAMEPDKVAALGIPDERVKYVQEDARRLLSWRPYMGLSDC